MSRELYSPPDPSGWHARYLRFVIFPMSPQIREERNWWLQLMGDEPEESTRRKDGASQAGPWGDKQQLSLLIDPFRVQWSLEPITTVEEAVNSVPSLGGLREQSDEFMALMYKWLKFAPPLKRIGIVCGAMYRVETHRDGYLMLDRLLKTVDVDPETTDFNYRVNRKTSSKIDGGRINQLATWSAVKVFVRFSNVTTPEQDQHTVNEDCFVSLELDVNTHHERTEPIQTDSIEAICRELAEIALARCGKGDVRE